MIRHFGSGLASVSAALLAASAAASTIMVNDSGDTAADDGVCTLREAIIAANTNVASGAMLGECAAGDAAPLADTIDFAIPGSGVHTMIPASPLPTLTEPVLIDGYSQPGASPNTRALGDDAVLLIEIDGSQGIAQVLDAAVQGVTIRGLVMNHLNSFGVEFDNGGGTVAGNFFQTDTGGTVFLGGPNGTTGSSMIIMRGAGGGTIGGTAPGDRNVIGGGSTTASAAVEIAGVGNTIQGNYIGINAAGTAALLPDVAVTAINTGDYGLSTSPIIGGTDPGAGNAIYGQWIGIQTVNATNAVIEGNTIGTDATGSYALGHGNIGIQVYQSTDTTIGGPDLGAGNVISGYHDGIMMYFGDEPGTIIQGNKIGTDITGTQPIPNAEFGINIASPGFDETLSDIDSAVGGTEPGEGNTIAYNCGAGISFPVSPTYTRWPILGNSIFGNGGLGITLDATTVPLPNDDGDADAGPNNLQNYPVITSAVIAGGAATLSGTLNSTPATTFRIEFFAGFVCNASGFGEGQTFIGTTDVSTDGSGNASFGPLSFAAPDNSEITATATDPDGNTSEFSQCAGPHDHLFASGFEFACGG